MTNLIAEIGKVLPKSRVAKSSEMKTKVTTTMFSGCGMNTKELEGIIEKYRDHYPTTPLEEFDVYTDGHPNAVIYDAIKNYLVSCQIGCKYTDLQFSGLFCYVYQISRHAKNTKDLWLHSKIMEENIRDSARKILHNFYHDVDQLKEKERDLYLESIISGAVIFLLSNLPNVSSRFRRDLAKLEQRYVKDKGNVPSFLPYLWKAIEEAPISQAVLEDEIAPEISEGFVPTILEECEQEPQQEVDQTPCANNENTHALKTCIFISKEEEEKWANIIKQFIADNIITTPLNGRGNNPTLAMVCYFYEKWKKEPGLLVTNNTQTILNFFTQKCGIEKATTDKNICNRISEYLKGDRNFDKIPDIKERVNQVFASYKLKKITTKK